MTYTYHYTSNILGILCSKQVTKTPKFYGMIEGFDFISFQYISMEYIEFHLVVGTLLVVSCDFGYAPFPTTEKLAPYPT